MPYIGKYRMISRVCLLHRTFLLSLIILSPGLIFAEDKKDDAEKKEEEPKTIAELTKDSTRMDGLFTLFQNDKTGEVHMLVKADQLDREFIYFAHASNGVPALGISRGSYLDTGVISFRRFYERVEIVRVNTAYYFDPGNALSRAADANISEAILAVEKIAAEDEMTGEMLISVDKIFLSEALLQVKPTAHPDADPKTTFTLGALSEGKSKITRLRNYPENTDIEVEYVYSNEAPTVQADSDVTDSRNVAIRVNHTLLSMPENEYQPRRDDPRVGYFTAESTELTSLSVTPYRDFIHRWHLVKKDPNLAVSEPKVPITWWIENTTPVEIRELIKSAALAWNPAFEKAGFKNALVVKIQPDDADWDAGDIRYNVLRWIASPNPLFGGSGPSFTNPRTGEILGADIMLEYSYLGSSVLVQKLFAADKAVKPYPSDSYCTLAQGMQSNMLFGMAAAKGAGYSEEQKKQLLHDTLYYLILHEIGHTLGLNHNMKGTHYISTAQAFDAKVVAVRGLAGSIMDYPALNFAPPGETQTDFYPTRAGPYDDWAIEYGYSTALPDIEMEEARLSVILQRSTEPALAFGNDADDMRSPGKSIDPRVNLFDMASDAVTYASRRMDLVQQTINNMPRHYPDAGNSFQETYVSYRVLMSQMRSSAAVVSRYIGGVYLDRGMSGQEGAGAPYTPVSLEEQQAAMQVLKHQVFAPQAFDAPQDLYRHLAQQRRGFNFFGTTEDPKLHDIVLRIQKGVLNHILHPVVMKRMSDSRLYGNEYNVALFVSELNDAIFAEDAKSNVNTVRQNLQMEYTNRLTAMVKGDGKAKYDTPSQNMAVYALNEILKIQDRRRGGNIETRAHAQNLQRVIGKALDTHS